MTPSLEEIIEKIMQETGFTREDVRKELDAIIKEFENFIDEESAAHYLAQKHGVNLHPPTPKGYRKIKELVPEMRSVIIPLKVIRILSVREFTRKTGEPGMVANLIVGDETGEIRLVLWDKHAQHIADNEVDPGDILMVIGGYVREGLNGKPELNVGNFGNVRLNPPDIRVEVEETLATPTPLHQLKIGMQGVTIKGTVENRYPPKTFTRKDNSQGKMASLILRPSPDQQNSLDNSVLTLRVACWDQHADTIQSANQGDIVLLEGVSIKTGLNNQIEAHTSSHTVIKILPGQDKQDSSSKTSDKKTQEVGGQNEVVFSKIRDIQAGNPNVHVIARVSSEPVRRTFTRKDQSQGELLSVTIGDETGTIKLTLWDEHARNNTALKKGDVLRVKHAYSRVGFRGDVELNLGRRGLIDVNPKGVNATKLKSLSHDTPVAVIPTSSLKDARENQMVCCVAAITRLNKRTIVYPACPNCNKKIQLQEDKKTGTCQSCGQVKVKWNPLLSGQLDDGTATFRFSMIGDIASLFLGMDGETIQRQLEEGKTPAEILAAKEQELLGVDMHFMGRVSRNSQTGLLEIGIRSVEPLDYDKEIVTLIDELSKYA